MRQKPNGRLAFTIRRELYSILDRLAQALSTNTPLTNGQRRTLNNVYEFFVLGKKDMHADTFRYFKDCLSSLLIDSPDLHVNVDHSGGIVGSYFRIPDKQKDPQGYVDKTRKWNQSVDQYWSEAMARYGLTDQKIRERLHMSREDVQDLKAENRFLREQIESLQEQIEKLNQYIEPKEEHESKPKLVVNNE